MFTFSYTVFVAVMLVVSAVGLQVIAIKQHREQVRQHAHQHEIKTDEYSVKGVWI